MSENKEELQLQVSELIHHDVVKIISTYSSKSILDLNLIITLVQDINLLKIYDVEYLHNNELDEVINIMKIEVKDLNSSRVIALLSSFEFLQNSQIEFKKFIYVNLSLRVPSSLFLEAFSFFNVLVSNVKELFDDFIKYIFNDSFLSLDENIQIDTIYKIWNSSQQLFHDNEASSFAYNALLNLFTKSLQYGKTELAFWLYYTPLHYYKSGVRSDIDIFNEEFKNEIEKPLEKYIVEQLVPKYNIRPNKRKMNLGKKRVAFVMQRIIRHSTMNVFYSLVKALKKQKNDEYEFVIYNLNFAESKGSDRFFVQEFKDLGIEYIDLHVEIFGNMDPTYSLLEKCIKTRSFLIKDEVDILIGLHTRIEYIFLYSTRTAPKQIYWYHSSNAQYDIKGIDLRITHGGIPNHSKYDFKTFNLICEYDENIDEELDNYIVELRNKFSKDVIILGSIGRLVKIDNEEYLDTVFNIMKQNPNTIYIACGDGDKINIEKKVKESKLEDRFFFVGFVNPKIYGRIIDIYLNTFPISSGEALNEYLAHGGVPIILLHKEHESIQEIFEKGWDRKFERIFSFSKEDYIQLAQNLIQNENIRTCLSAENINRFKVSGSLSKASDLFIEIIDNICITSSSYKKIE